MVPKIYLLWILDTYQGRHGRQGSQALVLDWILRNTKRQRQRRRTGEVAATMDCLPAKNLPWLPCRIHNSKV